MIITLKTDNPVAEIGVYKDDAQVSYYTWEAGRQLARDLLRVLHEQLQKGGFDWKDISGIVVFKGPGSFTGLRIGLTVANTLAYSEQAPIVGEGGDNWIDDGLARLKSGSNDKIVLPHYGVEANITKQKK